MEVQKKPDTQYYFHQLKLTSSFPSFSSSAINVIDLCIYPFYHGKFYKENSPIDYIFYKKAGLNLAVDFRSNQHGQKINNYL
jgi:hypothetical protein